MASMTMIVVMRKLTKQLYNDAVSIDGPNDDDNKNAVMIKITKTYENSPIIDVFSSKLIL